MRRWVVFNLVGLAGFAVQIAALAALLHAGVHYLAATVIAVEAAILHNFAWHERWTWRDRAARHSPAARLWRFHLLNGVVSLVGNVALMRVLAGALDVPPVVANLMAVLACSVVNFAAGDALVWSGGDGASNEAPYRQYGVLCRAVGRTFRCTAACQKAPTELLERRRRTIRL